MFYRSAPNQFIMFLWVFTAANVCNAVTVMMHDHDLAGCLYLPTLLYNFQHKCQKVKQTVYSYSRCTDCVSDLSLAVHRHSTFENVSSCARHGSGIGKHNDRPPLSTFLCPWFMSSCRSASPFICHDGTSVKAKLHQRACNHCKRLSDVSVFLLYVFCCGIFSAAVTKKTTIFVGVISRANGEFKLHTVKALHPKLSWNRLLLSLLLFV